MNARVCRYGAGGFARQMTSYRWTKHKVVDGAGNRSIGDVPISLWWLARAAAEETLQGSPMVSAWLTLFRTHLSSTELHELRWNGDLAESAELRRSYSGLYGRFMARALLTHHLGLSRFVSLKRTGISLPGSIAVTRNAAGDIPDWLAWDSRNNRFVLCEAKGSLTANDFLTRDPPRCVEQGKKQFGRVSSVIAGRATHPAEWVAASRWSTDHRGGPSVTLLWDPPTLESPFEPEEADRHREAITRAWLDSIAPGFGFADANEVLVAASEDRTVVVRAKPGPVPETRDWPLGEEPGTDERDTIDGITVSTNNRSISDQRTTLARYSTLPEVEFTEDFLFVEGSHRPGKLTTSLAVAPVYEGREVLVPRQEEKLPFEGGLIAALVTRFGIRPIRTRIDWVAMREAQDRARELREPAMVIGIPRELDPKRQIEGTGWQDGAGIAMPDDMVLFDLREVDVEPGAALPD